MGQDDQDDDDLIIDAQQDVIQQVVLVSQAYIEIVRGTLTSAPPRPILYDSFRSFNIVDQWLVGHPIVCHDAIGMSPNGLQRLTAQIERYNLVKPSQTVDLRTKLAITLWILRRAASNRTARDFWQFLQASISKYFHQVINALFHPTFYGEYVRQSTPDNLPTSHERYEDPKYHPLTKQCIGAIDGSHIIVSPPADDAARFRNRYGYLSTNVLGCVRFDGLFTYILAGYKGSEHDSNVYRAALVQGLKIPENHHLLADAGYGLSSQLVTPYRGVRYHLKEWARADSGRLRNVKELYNLRHLSCRNVIERTFGIVKARYKVLKIGTLYPLPMQIKIIYVCFALHNFIMLQGDEDNDWREDDVDAEGEDDDDLDNDVHE